LVELSGLDRFHDVVVEAGLFGALPVFVAAVTGHCDQALRVMILLQLAQSPGDVIAVQAGQPYVEQHDFRLETLGNFEGANPVVGDLDLMTLQPQKYCHEISAVLIVVNDQHSARAYADVLPGLWLDFYINGHDGVLACLLKELQGRLANKSDSGV
jgi:hypothetical protein